MPLNDFRVQISAKERCDLVGLGDPADRYDVSLTAATLRWLDYTERPAMLIVSREGFVLWARSSKSALKSGLYIKTRGRPPVELPAKALASQSGLETGFTDTVWHNRGVWLGQECSEEVLVSERYDMTFSLLHFDNIKHRMDDEAEEEDHAFTGMMKFRR